MGQKRGYVNTWLPAGEGRGEGRSNKYSVTGRKTVHPLGSVGRCGEQDKTSQVWMGGRERRGDWGKARKNH